MKMVYKVHIITEGKSEKAYFAKLSRFCRDVKGIYIIFEVYSCDGNSAKNAKNRWEEAQHRRDGKANEEVLLILDFDSFKRGDKQKSSYGFAGDNFYFFVMNFEDFLAHHLNEETLGRWKGICQGQNHFTVPMNNELVMQNIRQIWPGYNKGDIPFILNETALANLQGNRDGFIISQGTDNFIPAFLNILRSKGII